MMSVCALGPPRPFRPGPVCPSRAPLTGYLPVHVAQDIAALLERKKCGEVLEGNQLAKIGSKKEREEEVAGLEKQRREKLLAGTISFLTANVPFRRR